MKSFKTALLAVALVLTSFHMPSEGAATVTASKNYVDMKTKVETVTNAEVGVVGYTVGTNTNCVFVSTNYVDSKLGKIKTDRITDGTNTIDAAGNVFVSFMSPWTLMTNGVYAIDLFFDYSQNKWTNVLSGAMIACDYSNVNGWCIYSQDTYMELYSEADVPESALSVVFDHSHTMSRSSVYENKLVGKLALTNDIWYVVELSSFYSDPGVLSDLSTSVKFDVEGRDENNRTIQVLPFCGVVGSGDDNSGIQGRVVIPPYFETNGVRYLVTGVKGALYDFAGNYTYLNKEVIGPTSVTVIGDDSFRDILSLTHVSFPSVTDVRDGAFSYCTNLLHVDMKSVTNLSAHAFTSCNNLKRAHFPALKSAGVNAFFDCSSLESVDFPELVFAGYGLFYSCDSLKSVRLISAEAIGEYFSSSCGSLEYVYLPSVTNIGRYAFADCPSLSCIDFGSTPRDSVPKISAHPFEHSNSNCVIVVPDQQYDAWVNEWSSIVQPVHRFIRNSEWGHARRYSIQPADLITDGTNTIDAVGNVYTNDILVGKLALTNDIPPVVAPSTNATVGTAADAKAVGDALSLIDVRDTTDSQGRQDKRVAIGKNADASGLAPNGANNNYQSVAVGSNSKAKAPASVALGPWARTGGSSPSSFGVAIGYRSYAPAQASVAIGSGVSTEKIEDAYTDDDGNSQEVYAFADAKGAVQIGPGKNSETNSLKFRGTVLVDSAGKIPAASMDGTVVVSPTQYNGSRIAIGTGSSVPDTVPAKDTHGNAMGSTAGTAIASGVAIGNGAKVGRSLTVAIGSGAKAFGGNSVALGYNAETYARANNSVALGSNAIVVTNAENSVQLGPGTCTGKRTLQFCSTKIAQGTNANDIKILAGVLPVASASSVGAVMPDNTSVTVDAQGVLSAKPLTGRQYDFATNVGLYRAMKDVIEALGGSVMNFPAIGQ